MKTIKKTIFINDRGKRVKNVNAKMNIINWLPNGMRVYCIETAKGLGCDDLDGYVMIMREQLELMRQIIAEYDKNKKKYSE